MMSIEGPFIKDVRTELGERDSLKADIVREVAWQMRIRRGSNIPEFLWTFFMYGPYVYPLPTCQ